MSESHLLMLMCELHAIHGRAVSSGDSILKIWLVEYM